MYVSAQSNVPSENISRIGSDVVFEFEYNGYIPRIHQRSQRLQTLARPYPSPPAQLILICRFGGHLPCAFLATFPTTSHSKRTHPAISRPELAQVGNSPWHDVKPGCEVARLTKSMEAKQSRDAFETVKPAEEVKQGSSA